MQALDHGNVESYSSGLITPSHLLSVWVQPHIDSTTSNLHESCLWFLSTWVNVRAGQNITQDKKCVTFELVEDSPEFSDVSGERDVCVQDDDSLQVGWQRLGEHELHQAVDSRVMLVGDPWHLRLKHHTRAGLGSFAMKLYTFWKCVVYTTTLLNTLFVFFPIEQKN